MSYAPDPRSEPQTPIPGDKRPLHISASPQSIHESRPRTTSEPDIARFNEKGDYWEWVFNVPHTIPLEQSGVVCIAVQHIDGQPATVLIDYKLANGMNLYRSEVEIRPDQEPVSVICSYSIGRYKGGDGAG